MTLDKLRSALDSWECDTNMDVLEERTTDPNIVIETLKLFLGNP